MTRYRRIRVEGGLFFFTVTLADRSSRLLIAEIDRLRRMYASVQREHPFETIAICILPDHLHAIWSLPEGDPDYSLRWSLIKSGFSRGLALSTKPSESKLRKRERGIWQRRYWEHAIRNDKDLGRHIDYIHFNPVKHRLVPQVADWPYSSFHKYVERGDLPIDWGGDMRDEPGGFGE
jgi:putative transposase